MSAELLAENHRLRGQLTELLAQAHRNQQIMQRHQMLDLALIGAESFTELFNTLFQDVAQSSELDVITLVLFDPHYDIRRMLIDLNIDLRRYPTLLFLQEESELRELRGRLQQPALGAYAEQLHGPMFPEPIATPASVAVMPLHRRGKLIGCLNLGSRQAARFSAQMATDFITHRASVVAICIENVINRERLNHIGLTDALTRVNNRRYIEHRLIEEIGRSRRHGRPLSCLYIDIDHFKQINDELGHQAGDEVLRAVAAQIKAELRLGDALGRFGGEEFVGLLIDTDAADAFRVAERIRAAIAEETLKLSDGRAIPVTISVGTATMQAARMHAGTDDIAKNFLAEADRALYQAKTNGRNRVVSAQ